MGKHGLPFSAAVVALLGAASIAAASESREPSGAGARTGVGCSGRASQHPLRHRRRHGPCQRLRHPLGQDAEFRPVGQPGHSLPQRLYAQCEMLSLPGVYPDGAQPLAARSRRESLVRITPPKFKSWLEALADSGYFVGFTGKAWGPGELPPERKNITGKALSEAAAREARLRHQQPGLLRQLPGLPGRSPEGRAVLFLVRRA